MLIFCDSWIFLECIGNINSLFYRNRTAWKYENIDINIDNSMKI